MQNFKIPQKGWLRWLLFSGIGIFGCCILFVIMIAFAYTSTSQNAMSSTDSQTDISTNFDPTVIPTEAPTTEPTAIPTPAPTLVPTATAIPVSEMPVDEYLTMMVTKTLGQSTNYDKPRFVEVQTLFGATSEDVGHKLVVIRANKNLDKKLIVGGMLIDAVDYYSAISENSKILELDSVTILFTLPMVDTYGNTEEANVSRIKLTTETMNKINWGAFKNGGHRKFVAALDSYFLHAALR